MTVPASEAELVADHLFALGASAVSERPGDDGDAVLVADVDPALLAGSGLVFRVLDQDPAWSTAWHDTARAWTCGDRLEVRPVWVERPADADPDRIQVLLDPGATFGSGSHPTTRLCLVALEPLAPGSAMVLDVGCGTGVLGVAALALGAGALVAIDIDPDAVAATRRAVDLNGVAGRATVEPTPLAGVAGRFDLVLANLLLPVLEELGPELVAHLAPEGTLVISGLLEDQLDRATQALAPLEVVATLHDGDWVAATLAAPSK